ncbi:MAG: hypothetical protein R2845_00260 [Thermomicrobiales bacterium]
MPSALSSSSRPIIGKKLRVTRAIGIAPPARAAINAGVVLSGPHDPCCVSINTKSFPLAANASTMIGEP